MRVARSPLGRWGRSGARCGGFGAGLLKFAVSAKDPVTDGPCHKHPIRPGALGNDHTMQHSAMWHDVTRATALI